MTNYDIANAKKAMNLIEKSKFFEKFGFDKTRISGSTTTVFPIALWVEDKTIIVQLNSSSHYGIISSAKSLIKSLEGTIKIHNWFINKSDGSCPDTLEVQFL